MDAQPVNPADELAAICRSTLAGEGAAIRFNGQWTDWAAIRKVAKGVEDALARSGAGLDAPVAFAPRNSPASLAAFLPLLAQRRRIRMAYPFQSAEALAKRIATLNVAAMVMERADFTPPVIAAMQAQGMAGIALDPHGAELFDDLGAASFAAISEAPAIDILTSGTTGPPKHFAIPYHVVRGYVRQGEAMGRPGQPPTMLCFPLSNISGLYSLAMSFLRGAPVILLDRFTVEEWRDYVVEFRPSSGGAPPASLAMILAKDIPKGDLASLTSFSTGAAPVDPDVRKRFEDRYGIPVLQTYGATEFGGPVTAMSVDLLRQFGAAKAASVGRPFGGAEIRIRRVDDGTLAPVGEVGLVEVVSPRMGPDWIATADLGMVDQDGFLFLKGRADGAIMRGGFKIVPEVVEEALLTHPGVAEVAVVGLPDERLHELPVAAIVPADPDAPPTSRELEAHARRHLPATHVPTRWAVCEALPRTVSFKTDRAAVRRLCADRAVSPDR